MDEQASAYELVIRAARCRVVRIRLFDLTDEKTPWARLERPASGELDFPLRPDRLRDQLEAIQTARDSLDAHVEIVNPLIETPIEMRLVRDAVARTELDFTPMLETPASLIAAGEFVPLTSSDVLVGTRDLQSLLFGGRTSIDRGLHPREWCEVMRRVLEPVASSHRLALCVAAVPQSFRHMVAALPVDEVVAPPSF